MKHTWLAIVALLLSTLLILTTCRRSKSDEETPPDDGDSPIEAPQALPEPAASPDPQEGEEAVPLRLTNRGRERAGQPVVLPTNPRDTAFEAARFTAIPFHPRDTLLGAFGVASAGSARDRAVHSASAALFSSLLEGELPTGLLSNRIGPGGRAVLEDLIWAASRFSEIRLGLVTSMTAREASMPFRLIGESRYAIGEVILEKVSDQWYTADIQVEFFERDANSRFNPGVVRSSGGL